MTVQMNIEIPSSDGKVKYLGQLITFKNAVQVKFEHRIKCVWTTLTSHKQKMTSFSVSSEVHTRTFRRYSDLVTPPRISNVDDDRKN